MRQITIMGRIGGDATKETSKKGTEYIRFNVATNGTGETKDADGNAVPVWFRVTSFNNVGLAAYLTKGKPIIVTGDYNQSFYQDKNGATQVSNDIVATSINFVEGGTQKKED